MLCKLTVPMVDRVHKAVEIQKDFLEQTSSWRILLENKSTSPSNVCIVSVVEDSVAFFLTNATRLEGQNRNLGASTTTTHTLAPR